MTDNGTRANSAAEQMSDAPVPEDAAVPPAGERAGEPEQSGVAETDFAKEAAEYRDRWMRALAETENLRRRTEREVADARQYAVAAFARDMVGVADNMRRALETIAPELRDNADAGLKAVIEGVELTERELAKVLERHGVRKLEPSGQKFDPNFHQAMFEIPDTAVPAGTVVQVMQDGYTIGDRVLRPALVGVAKGGPKPSPVPANDDNAAQPAESGSGSDG